MRRSFTIVINRVTAKRKEERGTQEDELRRNNVNHFMYGAPPGFSGFPIAIFFLSFRVNGAYDDTAG